MQHLSGSKGWLALGATLALTFGAGCATARAPGTTPDDMSYAEHQRAARRFEKDAAKHERRYDPRAEMPVVTSWISDPDTPGIHISLETRIVNPTAEHLDHAKRRREIAKQHADAAKALKRYAEKYCKGVSTAGRKAHPLPGLVSRVEDIPGGVRLHLKPGIKANELRNKMACHIAEARLQGFAGEKDCPLHLRGLKFRATGNGRAVELVAKRSGLVGELRRRARAHKAR